MSNTREVKGDNFTVQVEKSPVERLVDTLVDKATELAGDTLNEQERRDAEEEFKIAEEALNEKMGQI